MAFTGLEAVQLIAVVCSGLFAGAAAYINLVEHPARMEGGSAFALREWVPSYRRATLMQAPLAVIGGAAALSSWFFGAGRGWLGGGVLLVSVVPFTLLIVMPTNRALYTAASGGVGADATALLRRWNRLHAVRTAVSTAAFLWLVGLLVGRPPLL